jgi:uncharacterized protein DUF2380
MHPTSRKRELTPVRMTRISLTIVSMVVMLLSFTGLTSIAANAPKSPVKIAVFDFELDDVTPAASILGESTSSAAVLKQVSSEARRMLAESGRYSVIDVSSTDAKPPAGKSLIDCDACEAGIARRLGAQQSLIGVVRRVTQTDYYVLIRIRDARSGKILDEQGANFAGSEEGWPSGVRMLIKHQVLASSN